MGRSKALHGTHIRERRLELGWTQEYLAERLGCAQAQLSRYELGTNDISGEMLVAVARELSVSADWLLGLSAEMTVQAQANADLDALEREAVRVIRASRPDQRYQLISILRDIAAYGLPNDH